MLKKVIGDTVASLLKSHGFKKHSLVWNRDLDDVVQVFEIQPSRWNDHSKEEFTINVGGVSKFAWETCWGKTLPKNVAIDECCPAFRVGELLNDFAPKSKDKWWCLSKEMSEDAIGAVQNEVVDVTRRKCLPLLNGLRTEADLLQAFEHLAEATRKQPANRLCYAILLAHNGKRSESEQELLRFEDPKLKAWNDRVLDVRACLGLDVAK